MSVPTFGTTVLDCPDPMALAGFYARLLDWAEPEPGQQQEDGWVNLNGPGGRLSFQRVPDHTPPTWPKGERPQQLHLDLYVDDLEAAHTRAVGLGARLLDDAPEDFRVYADPAGHPFCLCIS
ncbi:VOC family protein [Actinokineospora sp. PR83]|uniref:VOC family protein n=1 Tax=Actinokineospora sp. PR83 TaxID=2884908 RepID=UPI001F44CC69|nr:VOC family protein [Actinokineospora sp. PR83]MCG8914218.1 VOC family protein [Actinokineospora sp. PR83]